MFYSLRKIVRYRLIFGAAHFVVGCILPSNDVPSVAVEAATGPGIAPSSYEEAVSYGNPWAPKIGGAAKALAYAEESLKKNPNLGYCKLLDSVRHIYLNEPMSTVPAYGELAYEVLSATYPTTLMLFNMFELALDAAFLSKFPKQPSSVKATPSTVNELRLEFFPFPMQEQRAPYPPYERYWLRDAAKTVHSNSETLGITCSALSSLVNQILQTREKGKVIRLLSHFAYVSSHLMIYRDNNWGVHMVILTALRKLHKLKPQYSWGLDYSMLACAGPEAAEAYHREWSENPDFGPKLFEYFGNPQNAVQRKAYLRYIRAGC